MSEFHCFNRIVTFTTQSSVVTVFSTPSRALNKDDVMGGGGRARTKEERNAGVNFKALIVGYPRLPGSHPPNRTTSAKNKRGWWVGGLLAAG